MAIKETVESLAAKRGYRLGEVVEEMRVRGYEEEADNLLTGDCYRRSALLREILDLDDSEMKELHQACQREVRMPVTPLVLVFGVLSLDYRLLDIAGFLA